MLLRNVFFGILILALVACEEERPKQPLNTKQLKEKLIQANKKAVEKEHLQIEGYIKRRKLNTIATGSGVHYQVLEHGDGEQAQDGRFAVVEYELSLINGKTVYSTKEKGPEEFLIGKDNVESGLHEAIKLLKVGDRAIIIIPSYLAHGLAGDFNKVPVKATIIYNLKLVDLK